MWQPAGTSLCMAWPCAMLRHRARSLSEFEARQRRPVSVGTGARATCWCSTKSRRLRRRQIVSVHALRRAWELRVIRAIHSFLFAENVAWETCHSNVLQRRPCVSRRKSPCARCAGQATRSQPTVMARHASHAPGPSARNAIVWQRAWHANPVMCPTLFRAAADAPQSTAPSAQVQTAPRARLRACWTAKASASSARLRHSTRPEHARRPRQQQYSPPPFRLCRLPCCLCIQHQLRPHIRLASCRL